MVYSFLQGVNILYNCYLTIHALYFLFRVRHIPSQMTITVYLFLQGAKLLSNRYLALIYFTYILYTLTTDDNAAFFPKSHAIRYPDN